MKLKLKTLILGIAVCCPLLSGLSIKKAARTNANVELTSDNLASLINAIDLTDVDDTYGLAQKTFHVFDYTKPGFENLFVPVPSSKQYSKYASGKTYSEVVNDISKKKGLNLSATITAPVPNCTVTTTTEAGFDRSIGKSINQVNDEFYEYCTFVRETKQATVDWLNTENLENYFSRGFLNDLDGVKNISQAKDFLNKYGTHLLQKFVFGGCCEFTNYIVSEQLISNVYEELGYTLGLDVNINDMYGTNLKGSSCDIDSKYVNNSSTKYSMSFHVYGGTSINGMTVQQIFKLTEDIVGQHYMFCDWMSSFDKNDTPVTIIDGGDPVSLWDVLKNTGTINGTTYTLLRKAFNALSLSNYGNDCSELDISSDYLGEFSYTKNGVTNSFNLTSKEVKLPEDSYAHFEIGTALTGSEVIEPESLELILEETPYATLDTSSDVTVLHVKPNSLGQFIFVDIKYENEKVFSLEIEVLNPSTFTIGYGTKSQPYSILSISNFNAFLRDGANYTCNKTRQYFKLENDLDFNGSTLSVACSDVRENTTMYFDGANHKIKNFNIIDTSDYHYCGLFGHNGGIIKDLVIEDATIINGPYTVKYHDEVGAGILAGKNTGIISNVLVKNSAIRFSSNIRLDCSLSVGGLIGINNGTVQYAGTNNVAVSANSVMSKDCVSSVGGFIGFNDSGVVQNCYSKSCLVLHYFDTQDCQSYIGSFIGLISSNNGTRSTISYVVVYGFNPLTSRNSLEHIGVIAGDAVSTTITTNCYFESNEDIAVNRKNRTGCFRMSDISMESIGNSSMTVDWTDDADGKPILKLHVED